MKTLVLFACAFVVLASCASIDRYESEKPQITVIDLRGAPSDRTDESNVDALDSDLDEEDSNSEEYEDYFSGMEEIELPKVALSSKPKDPSAVLDAEKNGGMKTKGKGKKQGKEKGKGKGKKRNPCLRKYKSYCIHGTCQYVKELHAPSCICMAGYSGERCHILTMSTTKVGGSYDRTTALAIMAVVLSSLCLTVIAVLLAIRYHKRGAYDVENEEKVKLGLEPHH